MKRVYTRSIILAVLALAWAGIATVRLGRARAEFYRNRPADAQAFFASASLAVWPSLRPLLWKPWRQDVRLYFDHRPKINRSSPDAWASHENGSWRLKIHD